MNFKNFKLNDRNKFLLTVFVVCCVLVCIMAVSLNVTPDLRGKIFDKNGVVYLCANGSKSFSPQNGMCIE